MAPLTQASTRELHNPTTPSQKHLKTLPNLVTKPWDRWNLNLGDKTDFLHIRFPKPVTLTGTIPTQTSTHCNGRPARKVDFLNLLPQEDQDCLHLYLDRTVAVHYGKKWGSIYSEFIDNPPQIPSAPLLFQHPQLHKDLNIGAPNTPGLKYLLTVDMSQ